MCFQKILETMMKGPSSQARSFRNRAYRAYSNNTMLTPLLLILSSVEWSDMCYLCLCNYALPIFCYAGQMDYSGRLGAVPSGHKTFLSRRLNESASGQLAAPLGRAAPGPPDTRLQSEIICGTAASTDLRRRPTGGAAISQPSQ